MSKKRRGYLYKEGGAFLGKSSSPAPAKSSIPPVKSNIFKTAASKTSEAFKSAASKTGEAFKSAASKTSDAFKSAGSKTGEALKPENIKKGVQKAAVGTAFSIAKTGVNTLIPPIPFPPVSTLRKGLNETFDKLETDIKAAVQAGGTKEAFENIANTIDKQIAAHGPLLQQTFGVNIMDQNFRNNLKNTIIEHGPTGNIVGIMDGINNGMNDFMSKNPKLFTSGGNDSIRTFKDPASGEVRQIDFSKYAQDSKQSMNQHIKEINSKVEKESEETIKKQSEEPENPIKAMFPEKTEEQKEQEKIEAEAEKISFQQMLNELIRLYKDFKLAPIKVKLYIIVALLIVLTTAVLSFYYIVRLFLDYKNNLLIKNPINLDSLDYNISQSLSFNPATIFRKNIKYKFVLFLIFPIIALILILLALYYSVKEPNKESIKSIVYILITIIIVQSILSIIVNCIGYTIVHKDITEIQKKTSEFNNYIYLNLYTHQPFLNILQMIPTNSFSLVKAIQVAMSSIAEDDKSDPQKIAKVLFTLNIYIHLQKMGYRNPNIYNAFRLFNTYHTSDPKLFTPSDYIFRKPTYISNYSNKIIDIYNNSTGNTNIELLPGFINPNENSVTEIATSVIDETDGISLGILSLVLPTEEKFELDYSSDNINTISDDIFESAKEPIEDWMRNLNELAYKIDPSKGFSSFVTILLVITLISILPLIILLFARTLRHKLFKFILFITKSKTERLEIQINETNIMLSQLDLDLSHVNSSKKRRILEEKKNIYKDKLNDLKSKLSEAQKEKNK